MRVTDRALVLQAIRHGDRKQILRLYTQQHGAITVVAVPSRSPSSKIRPASLLPLSLIDAQLSVHESRDIHRLSESSVYFVPRHSPWSPAALAVGQFINEVLLKCMREQHANPPLYSLAEHAVMALDDDRLPPSFHLVFLKRLAALMGIAPQNNCSESEPYFDCREGCFSKVSLSFPLGLSHADSVLLSQFLTNENRSFTRTERNVILEVMEVYFRFHVPAFGELKSIAVVREIFAE
jgi:DNA repair protein RecO (recombination protein O)